MPPVVFIPRTESRALVTALAFCAACNRSPNTSARSPHGLARGSETSALPSPTTPGASGADPAGFQLSDAAPLPPVTIARELERWPADSTIEFWRTDWYMVRIYANGEVMFVGSHHVRDRYAHWTIPKASVDTLFRLATRAREKRAEMVVTSTVRLPFTPRPDQIRLAADAPTCEPSDPPMLCELARSIDEITGTAAYARCGGAGLPRCAPPPGRR
jgi:hypothetical protein